MKKLHLLVVLICLALVGVTAPAVSADAAVSQKGTYYPLKSARLLDTRTSNGAHQRPVKAGETMQLAVAGRGGIPASGVAAVVVNLTITGATSTGWVTAWPSSATRPGVSSIHYVKGVTRAIIATVAMNSTGKLALFNSAGTVNIVVDVVGFYGSGATAPAGATAGNEFASLTPDRLIDTRATTEGALAPRDAVLLYADFGVPTGASNASVKALALNITAVSPKGNGYLAAWDGSNTLPTTSTLNYVSTVSATANMAVVKTALCTDCDPDLPDPVQFGVYNGSDFPVDVLVDLVGVYYRDGSTGLRFSPIAARRISDSRSGTNGKTMTAQQTQVLTAPSTVAGGDTDSLVATATALTPSSGTYLSFWRNGEARPLASNLNAPAKVTVANGAVIGLSSTNKFNIYNNAGSTNFVIDVTGRFDPLVGAAGQRVASSASEFDTVAASSVRRSSTTPR
jgi:hypothetical protein